MVFFTIVISKISKLPMIVVIRCTVPHASLNSLVSILFVGTFVAVRNALIQNVLLMALLEFK
jgi:hypothetical protein